MLPTNTAQVLTYMGFQPFTDFNVWCTKGVFTLEWLSALPAPTEDELIATAESTDFINWLAENGGDPIATARKKATDALSDGPVGDPILREVIKRIVEEFNANATLSQALLDIIANAASLADLKSKAGALTPPAAYTLPELREEVVTRVFGPKA